MLILHEVLPVLSLQQSSWKVKLTDRTKRDIFGVCQLFMLFKMVQEASNCNSTGLSTGSNTLPGLSLQQSKPGLQKPMVTNAKAWVGAYI